MSRSNRTGKEMARQRVAAARVEAEQRAKRKRTLTVYGSALGVIVVAALVAVFVTQAMQPSTPPTVPAATVADTTGGISSADGMAVRIGEASAPVKLSVYEDFRCSACGQFESQYQSSYKALVQNGTLQLLIHPVDLIDNNDGGSGSLAAGNAAACAQNAGKFEAYHDVLYANQPPETTDAFSSNSALIAYGKQVPGLDTPTFESCVNSGKYDGWIKQNYADLEQVDGDSVSTPTLLANGTKYSLTTPAAFTTAMQQLALKVTGKAPAPLPTATTTGSATAQPSTNPSASVSASAGSATSASPSQSTSNS